MGFEGWGLTPDVDVPSAAPCGGAGGLSPAVFHLTTDLQHAPGSLHVYSGIPQHLQVLRVAGGRAGGWVYRCHHVWR